MRSSKIIHIPRYDNPYQELLIDSLRKLNIDVDFGENVRFSYLGDISVFSNVINDPAVNIIHIHWQHRFFFSNIKFRMILKSMFFIFQILLIRLCNKKVVWTVHNIKDHEKKQEKLEVFFSSVLAHLVNAIIVHCQSAKQEVCKIFKMRNKHKIVVIPHGNFLNAYANSLPRDQARIRLHVPPEDFVFLFLGNIRPYKGVLELIESFQGIGASNSKLIIAGRFLDQTFFELINQKIIGTSNIQMIPSYIPDDEIQLYMNASDIIVLPYQDILTSGAAILAMSFAKAIIAPKIGCLEDTLDNSGSFLYDPTEKDALFNALMEAIESREKLMKMGNHNLELAEKLSWHDVGAATLKVYQGL